MNFIKRNINRLKYALSGITYAIGHDFSFRMQWYGGIAIVSIILIILYPLHPYELLLILLGYILILITELQNSAFELALDKLHPELHHDIGRSKDMAAGSVLLAGLFLVIVLCVITFTRFATLSKTYIR